MQVSFVIDAKPDQFCDWLHAQTRENLNPDRLRFRSDEWQVHLQPVISEPPADPHSTAIILRMHGHEVMYVGRDLVQIVRGSANTRYISFAIVPINDQRTEVTASCDAPLVEPFFRWLLEVISRRYPTAAEDIASSISNPKVGLAESLELLSQRTMQSWWQGVVDCPLDEFRAAAQRHLCPLTLDFSTPEKSLEITPNFERNRHYYVTYYFVSETALPPADASNAPATQLHVIGYIEGAYHNTAQTRIKVDMVRSYDVQFAHLLTRFITDWRDALQPPLLPPGNTEPALALATPPLPDPSAEKPPWEQIPDNLNDRQIVKLLWDGLTDEEIGQSIGYSAKSISNRLSELRREYPDQVPTRDQLRQMRIESR